jgi:oligopeptide/dipeptide ABC transporter ATP-binding protein
VIRQNRPVLEVQNLVVEFGPRQSSIRVVDQVSLTLQEGRTLALVGESGSGKSVTSLAIMGLLTGPQAKVDADLMVLRTREDQEVNLNAISPSQMRRLRGDQLAIIFQEPMTSLNPSHTIGRQIGEGVRAHRGASRAEARAAALRMLERVSIPDAASRLDAYPHELSGGMRQRVMIAMALVCDPILLIADEPTTALDVTIQAQILDEMRNLQSELGMAMLFITHDLGVVAEIGQDVAVMYAGQVVEEGAVPNVLASPLHPYTRGLLASVPRPDRPPEGTLQAIPGRVPDARSFPAGCRFGPRCAYFQSRRCDNPIPLEDAGDGRKVRCVRWRELEHANG